MNESLQIIGLFALSGGIFFLVGMFYGRLTERRE